MKKITLLLMLLAPLWFGCKSGDPSEFGIEPSLTAYNDNAPVLKKSYCADGSCSEIMNEDRYSYHADGKLAKIENAGRTSATTMGVFGYTEYFYDAAGLLTRKATYGQNEKGSLILTNESEFEYADGILKQENFYSYIMYAGQKVKIRSVIDETKGGVKTGQRYLDAQDKLMYRVEYGYKNGILNLETWFGPDNKVNRTFEHKFSGNRRQIGEYLFSSREVLAMIEKTYDDKGRLLTQETKVNNPLLCSLPPGMIRYGY